MTTRVLVTGAAGMLGRCLWQAWEATGQYDLTLNDLRPIDGARSRVEVGDLFDRDFACHLCRGQDVLLALAYVPSEQCHFDPTGAGTDIAMNMQLFDACRQAGVSKIVYASSNHVTGWNEQTRERPFLSSPDEYNPTGWYGAMKGMAEIAGKALVNTAGMRFIGIRIGFFYGHAEPDSMRACEALLAPADAIQLFGLAIDYDGEERYVVTYGTSETGDYGNMDIEPARHYLGYRPVVAIWYLSDGGSSLDHAGDCRHLTRESNVFRLSTNPNRSKPSPSSPPSPARRRSGIRSCPAPPAARSERIRPFLQCTCRRTRCVPAV